MKPGKLQEEEERGPTTLLCPLQPVRPCTASGSVLPEQQGNAGPILCSCAQGKGHTSKEIEFSLPGTTVTSLPLSELSLP